MMNKKVFIGLAVVVLLGLMGYGAFYYFYSRGAIDNDHKISARNEQDVSVSIDRYFLEIQPLFLSFIQNKKSLPKKTTEGIPYYENILELKVTKIAWTEIIVSIYKYDPSNYFVEEGEIGISWKKDIKKEKEQIEKLSLGDHIGKLYFSPFESDEPFQIRNIGKTKFKVFDVYSRVSYYRSYETFLNDFFVEFKLVFDGLHDSNIDYDYDLEKVDWGSINYEIIDSVEKGIAKLF